MHQHYCDHALSVVINLSHLKPLNIIQWHMTGSKISTPFLGGKWEKQDGRPGLWLAETFSTSPLKRLNRIQQNLTGSKVSTSSIKFLFFWPAEIQDGRPGLWWVETFFTSLKQLNGMQGNYLNVLYQLVFRADRKSKMVALASDWLRHFRLLLCNRWIEFNEIWEEAKYQCPSAVEILQSFVRHRSE